ncbi:MAG: hypothetical protein ACHQ17_11315 [Polyangia bacterium]
MTILRAMVFIGLAWASFVLLASFEALIPGLSPLPVPAFGLLIVLYLGLAGRATMAPLVAVALAIGYLIDLLSGSPRWLHALTLAIVMVIARGASNRLLVASRWQKALVALVAALGNGALLVVLAAPPEWPTSEVLGLLRVIPSTALVTALLAPFVFALLGRLDRKLAPPPSAFRSVA